MKTVEETELERALQKVRNGHDSGQVAEEMAHRISQKILDCFLRELQKEKDYSEEVRKSREHYEKTHPKDRWY
jgi:glutamyl-tRNA reductase